MGSALVGWPAYPLFAEPSCPAIVRKPLGEKRVDFSTVQIMLGFVILLLIMTGIQLNRIEKQNEGLYDLLLSLGADPLRRKR